MNARKRLRRGGETTAVRLEATTAEEQGIIQQLVAGLRDTGFVVEWNPNGSTMTFLLPTFTPPEKHEPQ